jgi:hypothetical protein
MAQKEMVNDSYITFLTNLYGFVRYVPEAMKIHRKYEALNYPILSLELQMENTSAGLSPRITLIANPDVSQHSYTNESHS